uniref:ParA family protein n=1 Tax=Pseudonocardia sp. CA-138482 TaxID=3240023 RepID=UPI003F496314
MTNPEADLLAEIEETRKRASVELAARVFTVMSGKGGVGKTLIAMELAWLLDAVLLDLDWDGGNASRALGYLQERYQRAPLLDAIETGKTPRPKAMTRRPDLVAGHTDLETNQPLAEDLAAMIVRWAKEWNRPVVCDTHPGGSAATLGACAAADVVIMPTVLGTRELNAAEQTLVELGQYPLMLVPNWVPFTPPAAEIGRLAKIEAKYGVRVSPAVIREHRWMRTRKLRTVVTAAPSLGARSALVAEDMLGLAGEVLRSA